MNLFVDDDGYICFNDDKIFWTLHSDGWEAFLPGEDMPCYKTGEVTFPSDDDMGEVQEIYETWLEENE